MSLGTESKSLGQCVRLDRARVVNPLLAEASDWNASSPVLILLAAGKGTRFGKAPKCIQTVDSKPLARHSIDAFRSISDGPAVCLVGYQADQVAKSLGDDNVYVHSSNPVGGTALAAYEAFAVEQLSSADPIVVVSMGDRIVPAVIFQRLLRTHCDGQEADLTMLTAIYQPPRNQGKGRIVRDQDGVIRRVIEQRDLDMLPAGPHRDRLQSQLEGNCPLYAIRARKLHRYLGQVRDDNAQRQFYFTDIVEAIRSGGGNVRSITVDHQDESFAMLCSDVTRPGDLVRLEQVCRQFHAEVELNDGVVRAAREIAASRPTGQTASIAAQLEELAASAAGDIAPDEPLAIGISGGRLRIAFMHPDMSRFYGPAWQMPIGAADDAGRQQIVVMLQSTADGLIQLMPTNPEFQELQNSISAAAEHLYPGPQVRDFHSYEAFGTKMAESILADLGYVRQPNGKCSESDRSEDRSVGPGVDNSTVEDTHARLISNNMRRPFSLLANAIASLRTVREGAVGERIQRSLGREGFTGLKVYSTGDIPRGGFSSSSAVTVAIQNALNRLYGLGIEADQLVDLACQAEYGMGVRAGALDQATEQKGAASQGTLISSNPRDNYRILKTFPVPARRFRVLFPYTVDRDRQAWRWSAGLYAADHRQPRLTTGETRKMTGKSAEIAAILMRLPLDRDLFPEIEADLVETGQLTSSSALHVQDRLRSIPLSMSIDELRQALETHLDWYATQLRQHQVLAADDARGLAQATMESLLQGWRNPLMTRWTGGTEIEESGVPLRAMLGYLYAEVIKNGYLLHHPESWIQCVSQSQRGDRCFDIDPQALPDKSSMCRQLSWEKSWSGHRLMEQWLRRVEARPFDFNAGLSDAELARETPIDLRHIQGTSFFRGLPLIDLAEAMLKRAFGDDAVAVRVNGAGQGDYFQVHVDTELVDPEEVKQFIRVAFYQRFSLQPENEFVEPHPGGGAMGVKLDRFSQLPALIAQLRRLATAN